MKLLYSLLLILGAGTIQCSAQNAITLTSNDKPSVGKTMYVYHDSTTVFSTSFYNEAIKNGGDQTWDLSTLSAITTDTIEYVEPGSTVYFDSFPNAGVCGISSKYDNLVFFDKSNDGLFVDGSVTSDSVVIKYDSPQLAITYPSTYLDTFDNQTSIFYQEWFGKKVKINGIKYYADSVKKNIVYDINSKIDGYGTVITPEGSFEALRQLYTRTVNRETYVYVQSLGGWVLYKTKVLTTYKLRWWSNDYGYPVVECNYYPNGGIVRGFSYVKKEEPIVTNIQNMGTENMEVYPNPAAHSITFANVNDAYSVSIYTATGNLVFEKNNVDNINVEDWTSGMYFYTIKSSEKILQSGKFSVAH